MEELLAFFRELDAHNDREWFDAHRSEWASVKRYIASLAEELIAGIATFDPTVRNLRPQDCTFRIARDTRFSKDKSPYKNWAGIFIVQGGKKSGYAGYYIHISPNEDRMVGRNMLYAGLHCPESDVIRSVREEILDHGDELEANIRRAHGFEFYRHIERLKRTPAGFPTDSPYDDLLRMKEWGLQKEISEDFLLGDHLAERIVEELRPTAPLVTQLNRAVEFAYEERLERKRR